MSEMIDSSDYNKDEFTSLAEMFAGKMVGIYKVQKQYDANLSTVIKGRAKQDYESGEIFNGYPESAKEYALYNDEIKRLKVNEERNK